MSTSLSQEQKDRMEENRKKALALRAAKLKQQQPPAASISLSQPHQNKPIGSAPKQFYTQQSSSSQSQQPSSSSVEKRKYPTIPIKSSNEKLKYGNDLNTNKKGSLVLISRERFELVMDYHQPTIDAIKAVPGRQYDMTKKNWNFPLTQYEKVRSVLKNLQPSVVVGDLPSLVVETFVKRRYTYSSDVDLSRIQSSMRSTLMDFQVESVKYSVSRGGRVLIADDMGLGKTIQALAIADYYHDEWPLLIVCPSSMRFQWVAEIRKHLKNVNADSIFVITNGKDVIDCYSEVVITSYDLMSTFETQLLAKKFGVVIMDESHHLKNPKAIRTKAGTKILTTCKRCILLSGTPVLSRPVELHCQLKCIRPQIFNKFMDFALRYCDAKQTKWGWNYSGSANMNELNIVLKELLMIRRLKSDVLSQLPPKTREVVMLGSTTGPKLSETSEFAKILDAEGLKGLSKVNTLMSYFQETSTVKIKGVTQYVEDMIENGEKFLIFAHHGIMMDAICTAVEKKKTDYIRIDGSVKSEVRKDLCNHFQEQENCLVAVLSIKAANTGLTLTAARLVIFAELWWNPGDLIQAEDRAHRIGQADSVLVQYLVQRGTADDQIWPLIQLKLDVLSKAGLSQDDFKVESSVHAKSHTEEKTITDYFSQDDDMMLADLDLSTVENSFEVPEKKARIE
ncbi:SWI/SNF-related matrix-associated actin-dependent regulator of chromatin subfamily A-like protein 1 [Frankliniella occidentalis]|uniref:SWI/SNF-related matrix-associated actin-dependent regulator of chromatin subfamily A-like protein 1 n=1 Tax=Frankliniella occidentalis TaxID=133901 RepID=A0A6J1RYF3_FRAOC|nr:SWI/SNF-related matrix-associated actin-dependent regulator of chromatin subfamily A-like protein 1 [Frankliniella occidentalis]